MAESRTKDPELCRKMGEKVVEAAERVHTMSLVGAPNCVGRFKFRIGGNWYEAAVVESTPETTGG